MNMFSKAPVSCNNDSEMYMSCVIRNENRVFLVMPVIC